MLLFSSSAPGKTPQPARRSRWDVADQKRGEQQERKDPLSELLSAARQQADNKPETSSAPALPAPSGTGTTEVGRPNEIRFLENEK